ncbi:carotenoid oxygenase [Hyaloscypha variabilis F]|uniref:Carotenoid oxygenase n=1 Tax=Hyaloscypha variabilis (strain UAMH 11265 / GT02V1 / F) TaxID=1149755 RepID=A0A2J6QT97_HYAVF|nr:carotenoid oxygenase [Hyaloscypha variabilis F]
MAGHFRSQPPTAAQAYPDRPQFSGFMKPCRFEGELQNLEVTTGKIPLEIDGTFYRVMPDPQLPPFIEDDVWFNGDGNISAFRIRSGRCHFKQRYVRTEKFVRERQAQRALIGRYRNKYTDAVEFKIRSTANTNIVYFNGRLLACKEDSPPYAVNAETLETIGLEDFDGQLPSLTFTAHPKLDPVTKEFICFGYEAKGDGTPDIYYFSIGPDGKFLESVWLVAPVVAMIHDFAVTENWIIFPIIPLTADVERMKNGGEHWQWTPDIPFYIGVLPRHGAKGEDVKWFRAPNAFAGHTANAFEKPDGSIVFELPVSQDNVFFWWPDKDGKAPIPQDIRNELSRFTFDPRSTDLDLSPPELLLAEDVEFPRIDDRYLAAPHSQVFLLTMDPKLGTDFAAMAPVMGGGSPPYNALGNYDHRTKTFRRYFPGTMHLFLEPVFIPRSQDAAEGDGWVLGLVNNYSNMLSELHIVDTTDFEKPCAIVSLPVRLRPGLHGNWVDAQDLALAD